MRSEIDKNHLQVQLVKTNNPRTVVENSAHEINLSLTDVRRGANFIVRGESGKCI